MKSPGIVGPIAALLLSMPFLAGAAPPCPPEVKEARDRLTDKTATVNKSARPEKTLAGARGEDVQTARGQKPQAPRSQDVQAERGQKPQAPRGQDAQAARGQDPQTARGQDAQAARGQDPQTARGQDAQAARGQDAQAARNVARGRTAALANARKLVIEAETACKEADDQRASANARAALELLRYLP